MPRLDDPARLASTFGLLSDPVRLRILDALADRPADVWGLCERLRLSQPLVSSHLVILGLGGLVARERGKDGTTYRLAPGALAAATAFASDVDRAAARQASPHARAAESAA